LSIGEGSSHLWTDKARLHDLIQGTKADFVLNFIANYGALHAVPHLRNQFVTVMPAFERSLHLDVDEVVIPCKFCDPGNPAPAEGELWHYTKRSHDF
jgi:hypothetical protein